MEKGKVRKFFLDKNIGWVSRATGGDAFIPPREVPKGEPFVEGDELEFEVGDDPKNPGKFVAKNVRVINRVPRKPPPPPPELGVGWEFGPTRLVTIQEQDEETGEAKDVERLQLPIWVVLVRGDQPVRDEEVALDADGKNVVKPSDVAHTDKDGRAFFLALLPPNALDCRLLARIKDKNYTGFWQIKPATPDKVVAGIFAAPTPPTAERLNVSSEGVYTFRVTVRPQADVMVEGNVPMEWRSTKQLQWTQTDPVQAGQDGSAEIEVRAAEEGTRGDIRFVADKLLSKPWLVRRTKPAEKADNTQKES